MQVLIRDFSHSTANLKEEIIFLFIQRYQRTVYLYYNLSFSQVQSLIVHLAKKMNVLKIASLIFLVCQHVSLVKPSTIECGIPYEPYKGGVKQETRVGHQEITDSYITITCDNFKNFRFTMVAQLIVLSILGELILLFCIIH